MKESQPKDRDETASRRGRAVKTAWVLGVVAAVIFAVFILSGVLRA